MIKLDKNMCDEIARVAYSLYEKRGRTPGNDLADWVEAEKIVMKKYGKGVESGAKALASSQPMKAAEKTKSRSARMSY
jgi:hypothetical protein